MKGDEIDRGMTPGGTTLIPNADIHTHHLALKLPNHAAIYKVFLELAPPGSGFSGEQIVCRKVPAFSHISGQNVYSPAPRSKSFAIYVDKPSAEV